MQGFLYMEDRGESGHQRWGTPVTPAARKLQAAANHSSSRASIEPRNLIALDKAALGVSEDWRDRISLKCDKRKESSVRVVARFRPPSEKELQAGGEDCKQAFKVHPGSHRVETVDGTHGWDFDMAFSEDCSQEAVYNAAGHPVISGMLDGYNGTIFAYGQTGSGKTHCMFGPSHDLLCQTSDYRGIVPRAAQHVFDYIRNGVDGSEFELSCSLFEVYREQLRDLLDPHNPNLRIKETPRQGVFVDGLAQEFVACEDDVIQLLLAGSRLRAVAATRLNQHSSRSHVIFSLTCEQRLSDGTEKLAKLNLVDLAGSEKVSKSSSSGVTLEEAKKINLSLSALGNVINALASHKGHVPYRNSKLTRILQETLGGNFKTALVVTCSPLRMHVDETLSSLHFAARAKAVRNHIKMNFVYSAEQLMAFAEHLQHELLTTRREIAKHPAGHIHAGLPEAAVVGVAPSPSQQTLQWDASLLDKLACCPSPSPVPASKQKAHGPPLTAEQRLLALAERTQSKFSWKLVAHDELMCDLKAVIGAGLAHELRSGVGALINGTGSGLALSSEQVTTARTLDVQQDLLQKLVKSKDLRRRLLLARKSLKESEARRTKLSSYCEQLDAQIAQTQQAAVDLQCDNVHDMLPEFNHSLLQSPRAGHISAGSEALGTLDGYFAAAIAAPAAADVAALSSAWSGMLRNGQRPAATSVSDAGDAPVVASPHEALQQELEMLEVDFEREEAMRHMHIKEDNAHRQHWYKRAHAKLRDLDQAVNEEPRLYDLVQRRRTELMRSRERLARRRQELHARENDLSVNAHLKMQSSASVCSTSNEDAKLQSKCLELYEAILRLKDKNDAPKGDMSEKTACQSEAVRALLGGA